MGTPLHKFDIPDAEGQAALADLKTQERAFDLLHLQHQKYTHSHKVAILLRRIDQLEKDLQAAQVKLNYGSYHY